MSYIANNINMWYLEISKSSALLSEKVRGKYGILPPKTPRAPKNKKKRQKSKRGKRI